jgi:cyclic dehypoxanthinyl futalosine synthase
MWRPTPPPAADDGRADERRWSAASKKRRSNMSTTAAARQAFARLSDADALEVCHELSIHELGRLAFERSLEMHPEPYRTYVVDRNINYANVCTARCIFCNFYARPGAADAYILSYEQIGEKIEELIDIGGTQILMQGGLVPDESHPSGDGRPFAWYLDLLRFIKRNYPGIHIHAFSPPEIWAFHKVFRMPLRDALRRLQEAGLDTIPGGGAEILVDRVRRKIGQGKTMTDEWLAVMREAHKLGMKTSCTMMFGHIETIAERIEHLCRLRELQDETGGFIAFIHWPFQPEGTPLGRWKVRPLEERHEGTEARRHEGGVQSSAYHSHEATERRSDEGNVAAGAPPAVEADEASGGSHSEFAIRNSLFPPADAPRYARPDYLPDGEHLQLADAHEYLRMLALARLYLDNIPNIQSSWVTMGPKIGQLALFFGANDMGSVMMEENVVSAAGTTYCLSEAEIRRLITEAGWTPKRRDQYYRPINPPRQ